LIKPEGEMLAAGILGDDGTVVRYTVSPNSLGNFLSTITQEWQRVRPTGTLVTLVDTVSQSTGGPHTGGGGPGGSGGAGNLPGPIAAAGSTGGPHTGGGGPGGKEPYWPVAQGQAILAANVLRSIVEIINL
jgi:hypothetical protein